MSFLARVKAGRKGGKKVERTDAWVEEVKKEVERGEEH